MMAVRDNDERVTLELRRGQAQLLRRALRYYYNAERGAVDLAARAGNKAHAADVRRQVEGRLLSVNELLQALDVAMTRRSEE